MEIGPNNEVLNVIQNGVFTEPIYVLAFIDKKENEIATRATTLEDWMKSWVGESTEEFN
jgi:hypothetical protein